MVSQIKFCHDGPSLNEPCHTNKQRQVTGPRGLLPSCKFSPVASAIPAASGYSSRYHRPAAARRPQTSVESQRVQPRHVIVFFCAVRFGLLVIRNCSGPRKPNHDWSVGRSVLQTYGGNPGRRSPRRGSGGGGAGAEGRDAGGGALQAQVSLFPTRLFALWIG
jgi:hypothetical protein